MPSAGPSLRNGNRLDFSVYEVAPRALLLLPASTDFPATGISARGAKKKNVVGLCGHQGVGSRKQAGRFARHGREELLRAQALSRSQ